MPAPAVTLSIPLAGYTVEEFSAEASRRGFIGALIAPTVNVSKDSGEIGIIPVEALLQENTLDREMGAGYTRQEFEFNRLRYACRERGFEDLIDDREASIYRDWIDMISFANGRGVDMILRAHERRVATMLHDTNVHTANGITNEWDDLANATPVDDIDAGILAVEAASGMPPNALQINSRQFRALRNCAQVLERVKYGGSADDPAAVGPAALAELFGLDYVFVGGGVRNTANAADAATPKRIWGDEYAALLRVPTTSDPKEPCSMRTFHYDADGSDVAGMVEVYREESRRSDVVRTRHDTDELSVVPETVYLFSNVITTPQS
jgi:hypothetical protein